MERSAASIKSMWARRSIVALLALVVGVFGLVAGSPRPTSAVGNPERSAPTTWASGGWFSYDGSPLHSCFAVLQDHGYLSNERATSPPAAARDRSTVPCGQVLGASTTPSPLSVATDFIDDDVVLVRGGLNQPENFAGGTGSLLTLTELSAMCRSSRGPQSRMPSEIVPSRTGRSAVPLQVMFEGLEGR
jgi:hypothetical protein